MSARNWDRVRQEKLCKTRGTERVGEEHPPEWDAYSIYKNTLPGGPNKSTTNGFSKGLLDHFKHLDLATEKRIQLKSLSDDELWECRGICEIAIRRINELLFDRTRPRPPFRIKKNMNNRAKHHV